MSSNLDGLFLGQAVWSVHPFAHPFVLGVHTVLGSRGAGDPFSDASAAEWTLRTCLTNLSIRSFIIHPSSRPSSHLVIHSSIICSSLHPSIHPPDVHLLAHPFIHPPIRRERLGPRQQERRLRHDLLSAVSAACGAQPRAGQGLGMSSPTLHTQTKVCTCDQSAGAQEDHPAVADDRRVSVGRTAPGTTACGPAASKGASGRLGAEESPRPRWEHCPRNPGWRTVHGKARPTPATDLQSLAQNENVLLVQKSRKKA